MFVKTSHLAPRAPDIKRRIARFFCGSPVGPLMEVTIVESIIVAHSKTQISTGLRTCGSQQPAPDVALFQDGRHLDRPPFGRADEIQIVVRASKTDAEGEKERPRHVICSGAMPLSHDRFFANVTWQPGHAPKCGRLHRRKCPGAYPSLASAMWDSTRTSLRPGADGIQMHLLAYLWTSRKASSSTAARMAATDMTPVRGFPNAH